VAASLGSQKHPGGARARGEARFAFSRRTAFPWSDTCWVSAAAHRQGKAAASKSSPLLAWDTDDPLVGVDGSYDAGAPVRSIWTYQ
jgi:hypothetical protein